MENDKLRKIFVGNVPYQCTVDEFQNTFSKIDGFMDADIIIDKNTNMCKGFGFVRLNTIQNAEKLLKKTDLKINGRELRLTGYTSTLRYSNDEKIGYIYVVYSFVRFVMCCRSVVGRMVKVVLSFVKFC